MTSAIRTDDATVDAAAAAREAEAAAAAREAEAAADQIRLLRGQIDALDTAIVRLVAERAALSSRVQAARMNTGGTRVELGREREILAAYRAALGSHGPAVADAILQVCRGAR